MSVFKPSTADIRPASMSAAAAAPHLEDVTPRTSSHRSVLKFDTGAVSSLSLALSLSKSVLVFTFTLV